MNILVANIGSTSFKYRLFDMDGATECVRAEGGRERVTDHGQAIESCLQALVEEGHLSSIESLDVVGFKTVLGKDLSGCVPADERALKALDDFKEIAPAHNPPYAASIRYFRDTYPSIQRVALFETAFYQWVPKASRTYALPKSWRDLGIERLGFHGASHKFVAERAAEVMDRPDVAERVRTLYIKGPGDAPATPFRIVSCHLGGSSSVTGTLSGVAIGTSMGLSPQSGLPQNNRVGDLDSNALPYAMTKLDLSLEEAVRQMNKEGGLLGISGISNDLRDIKAAADTGHADAQLALDVLVDSIRGYIGSYMFKMGGLDALVFTAGIGEHNPWLRKAVCAGLEGLGLTIDPALNDSLHGEGPIHTRDSTIQAWVIPTNEELVIARETQRLLQSRWVGSDR
ncbi:MAG: acetate kinase [Kiritimatiellae bacterium]|jgi:acetate kinase|nr:acetate kinase [Kiritimatiellia bacterium]